MDEGVAMTEATQIEEPDASLGVKESPVFDCLIVDREAGGEEPPKPISNLTPGDKIRLLGDVIKIGSTSRQGLNGRLFRLGIPPQTGRAISSLWVDREPYLLDVCNGGIYTVEPESVDVIIDKIDTKQ